MYVAALLKSASKYWVYDSSVLWLCIPLHIYFFYQIELNIWHNYLPCALSTVREFELVWPMDVLARIPYKANLSKTSPESY